MWCWSAAVWASAGGRNGGTRCAFSSRTGRCSFPAGNTTGGEPDDFAHYTEIVRIIEDYVASTRAPVREHTEVVGMRQDKAGAGFVLSLAAGPFVRGEWCWRPA
jgi:hypothetical protein